jgi:hypothetical protein
MSNVDDESGGGFPAKITETSRNLSSLLAGGLAGVTAKVLLPCL